MWNKRTSLKYLFCAVALICSPAYAGADDQALATVGQETIYSRELELALASSPFSTQFNTMSEDEQASLRGDMLRRLVSARLLALEAKRLGLDQTAAFRRELADFRLGLLYRAYMEKMRAEITIPADALADMKAQSKGDADGFEAAKSAYVAVRFQAAKQAALQELRQESEARIYESRIKPGIKADAVLMEGNGFRIVYGDLVDAAMLKKMPNPEWLKQQLRDRGDMVLAAKAAESEGADVSAQLGRYLEERLPAAMMEKKIKEWVPDEKALHNWYAQHPEIGRIPAAYHVGQIVVASRLDAEKLRARIVGGESLFTLAASESIDPAGRERNGDMGWITEGRGMPELLKVLPALKDDQLSEVIATPAGYHLVTVLERRIGRQKEFEDVRERVKQMMVNQNLPAYLGELEKRYPVSWNLMAAQAASQVVAAP